MVEKSRGRTVAKFLVLAVILLPAVWLLMQQIGPRATPLAQDPVETLNAERAAAGADAAELYAQAWTRFAAPDFQGWDDECGRRATPLPDELVAWVEGQAETVEKIRQAVALPDCYFRLQRVPEGIAVRENVRHIKRLARLLSMRARLATDRHDAALLADSLELMNGMARHVFQQPTLVEHLVGCAIIGLALEHVSVPYEWEEAPAAELDGYGQRVACLFTPLPPLTAAIEMDRQEAAWMVQKNLAGPARFVLSPARISGELKRWYAPYLELAAQPAEVAFAPDNPVLAKITRTAQNPTPAWMGFVNLPRFISQWSEPALRRVFDLHVRCVATQRGHEAVAAVFAYYQMHGRWPESLDELGTALPPDPYTAAAFIYRRTDDGFTLYSAGLDRDDDGGRHDERFGEKRPTAGTKPPAPDGDYVFWPLREAAQGGSSGG